MRHLVFVSCVSALLAGACATPRVLVGHEFLGSRRTSKLIIQKTSNETFDTYMRVCNLLETGEEQACVDTLLLSNVNPSSIY